MSFAPVLGGKPSCSCDNEAEDVYGIVGSLDPLRVVRPLLNSVHRCRRSAPCSVGLRAELRLNLAPSHFAMW